MHLLMAAMLWNAAPTTTLLQVLVLAGAALWFIIQAVARPHYRALCTGTRDRIKCTYHALTMAAAAIMIAMMTNHTTTPANTTNTASPATAHTHHTTTTGTGSASIFQNTPALATILTIAFAAAATVFLVLLLRRTHTTTTHHHTKNTRTEHGLEAAGATTMALMFATMTT